MMKNSENKATSKKNVFFTTLRIFAVLFICTCGVIGGYVWFNKDEPAEAKVEVQVQNALQNVLDAAISADENPDALLTESESRSGFEVLSCTETNTGAIVTFLVHAPDLYTVAKNIDENYTFETEEELRAALIDAVNKAQVVNKEVTIEFEKTDDGYEPILSIEFIDAYYGGILKLYNEKLTTQNQKEAEK